MMEDEVGEGEEEDDEEPERPLFPLAPPLLLRPLLLPPDDGESIVGVSGERLGVRGGFRWWSCQEEDEADMDEEELVRW